MVRSSSKPGQQGKFLKTLLQVICTDARVVQVPAVAYGGSVHPPAAESDSVIIAESLVLIDFIADLAPNSSLLPKDPVTRAKARFFIEAVRTTYTSPWLAVFIRGDSEAPDEMYKAHSVIQDLLPDNAIYAVSNEYTTADVAIAPSMARTDVCLRNDLGAFKEGEGKKIYEVLKGARSTQRLIGTLMR